MASRYYQITEGEWIDVPRRGHHNACCDCALVHIADYRIKNGVMQVRYRVNRRSTAALRRAFKFTKEDGD